MLFDLTSRIRFFRIELLSESCPTMRVRNPGGRWPNHRLSFLIGLGYESHSQSEQSNQIENHCRQCLRFRVAVKAPVTVNQCHAITVTKENRRCEASQTGNRKSPRRSYFGCWKAQGARHKSVDSCTAPPRSEQQRFKHARDPKLRLAFIAIVIDYCLAAKEPREKLAEWL